jgi:hypothetical protein|tara:strand:- start:12 stop:215 length:204 start_codon:yes stop_codon:yes gene_type:complete
MKKDYFESVYLPDGIHPDPYGVLEVIKNASSLDLPLVIEQIKEGGLDININVRREVEKYEHQRDMSS